MAVETILTRLRDHAHARPQAAAYHFKEDGVWQARTWSSYWSQVSVVAQALIALGIEPGDKTAILGFNRPEWTLFCLGTMLAGGVTAGVYATNAPEEVQYIVGHAGAKVFLVENELQWAKMRQIWAELPALKTVIFMRSASLPADAREDNRVLSWEEFLQQGEDTDVHLVEHRLEHLELGQPATLIYTSGTTGPPKAAMLSHRNLTFTSQVVIDLLGFVETQHMLSYLPLSHVAEQMLSIHVAVYTGYQIYYAEAPEMVADNLKEVQPTVVFGVPRVWERFYNGLNERLNETTGVRARRVTWARGVAGRVTDLHNQGLKPSGVLAMQYRLADKLVLSKVKKALGLNQARMCFTGAAPISPHILEFLAGLDINVWEVYGQSEGTGGTSTNFCGNTRYGTVGKALPRVEVKLAEDGEILFKGGNVFLGYYKDPEATAEILRNDWLYSGDLGEIDSEGFLTVTGRKKDIIITSGGKNIAPKNIEAALVKMDLVEQALIFGEGRRYITALLTLDEDTAKRFATEHGVDTASIHMNADLLAALQRGIDEVNSHFARVEQVREFYVAPEPFSVETGELTPTLKLKRQVVYQHYSAAIEAMYAE